MKTGSIGKLIAWMTGLFLKFEELILYGIFGVLTTIVNFVIYILATDVLHIYFLLSNLIAFVFAVTFAFFTNKIWVFKNKNFQGKKLFFEFTTFMGARILSLLMDMSIMYVFVQMFELNDLIVKIGSNVLMIILNYFFSKFYIFKKKNDH